MLKTPRGPEKWSTHGRWHFGRPKLRHPCATPAPTCPAASTPPLLGASGVSRSSLHLLSSSPLSSPPPLVAPLVLFATGAVVGRSDGVTRLISTRRTASFGPDLFSYLPLVVRLERIGQAPLWLLCLLSTAGRHPDLPSGKNTDGTKAHGPPGGTFSHRFGRRGSGGRRGSLIPAAGRGHLGPCSLPLPFLCFRKTPCCCATCCCMGQGTGPPCRQAVPCRIATHGPAATATASCEGEPQTHPSFPWQDIRPSQGQEMKLTDPPFPSLPWQGIPPFQTQVMKLTDPPFCALAGHSLLSDPSDAAGSFAHVPTPLSHLLSPVHLKRITS